LNGSRVVMAGYDATGGWNGNPDCYRLPEYSSEMNARNLWPADGTWMGHRIDSPIAVRRSGLFPRFEADAIVAAIEREPIGADAIPDLVLLNYKGADFVGHQHGPASAELQATLAEVDRHLARVLAALERKVGQAHLVAVTADHGMPGEPGGAGSRHVSPELVDAVHARFDPDTRQLVTYYEPENSQLFIDEDRLAALGLTLGDVARFLETQPYIFAAFTQEEVRRR
jgi:hypothetical protein